MSFGYSGGLGATCNFPKGFALTLETAEALKKLRSKLLGKQPHKIILRHQAAQSKYHCHVHFQGADGPAYGCAAKTPADVMNTLADMIEA